ncbi:MAG: type II toxin-antitoxin system RelE/ParE family toxin [Pseudolabrys sp.]|jgi:putative addiction module killer protein|nr:type II toxin-antitoxin system RelE/ParE family toxin [Pseudolabrys sp.]
MLELRRTADFDEWLKGLRDTRAKAKILVRIERLARGNPGDVAPVGQGISELRVHFGPGYRVYFKQAGMRIVVLLCGGDKDTQATDILRAQELAKALAKELDE